MQTVPEQWILLTLDETTGKLRLPRSAFECGITAGMLLELGLAGRIRLIEDKKIKVMNTSPTNDPLLYKALYMIAKSKKPKTVLDWMIQLTMQDSRVIESFFFKQMVNQDILKMETRSSLGIFKSKYYIPISKELRIGILQSLMKIIHQEFPKENRPICLLGLAAQSGYVDKILDGEQASLLSQNSPEIFSHLEKKRFSPSQIPFFLEVIEALKLSQQSAGEV